MKAMKGYFSSIRDISFFMRRAFKLNPKAILIKIPRILLNVLLQFIPLYFLRTIINGIQLHVEGKELLFQVVFYAASMLLCWLIGSLFEFWDERLMNKTYRLIRVDITKHVIRMPYSEVESPKVRTFIEMIDDNVDIHELLEALTNMVKQILVIAGLVGIISTLEPSIVLLIVVVLVIKILISRLTRNLWNKWRESIYDRMRKVNYILNILCDPAYGKEIRINGLQKWMGVKFSQAESGYIRIMKDYNRALQKKNGIVEISFVAQELLVFLILAYRVFFDQLLIGDFTMYLSGISSFSNALSSIIDNTSTVFRAGDYFALYRELLNHSEEKAPTDGSTYNKNLTIRFEHVSFTYPGSDQRVLKDINLVCKTGESLSIVGMNGAGKSTLVKLLCRFYEPDEGVIYINDTNIHDIPMDEYKKLLSVVFQDYTLYGFSVAENITLSSESNEETVYDQLKKCGLDEKVRALPNGLNTSMSKVIDDWGVEFSGGESQRIELARALYKDSPVMILDEPTASLDPIKEYELYQMMDTYTKDKCSIFISHRLASTKFTDYIAVFEDGRIVEYGTHDELMEIDKGVFKEMFEVQSSYYK